MIETFGPNPERCWVPFRLSTKIISNEMNDGCVRGSLRSVQVILELLISVYCINFVRAFLKICKVLKYSVLPQAWKEGSHKHMQESCLVQESQSISRRFLCPNPTPCYNQRAWFTELKMSKDYYITVWPECTSPDYYMLSSFPSGEPNNLCFTEVNLPESLLIWRYQETDKAHFSC